MSSQEIPAFYFLVKNKILPEDTVVIPGHTGDFICGGHIPVSILNKPLEKKTAIEYIFEKHFTLQKEIKFGLRKIDNTYIKRKIGQMIDKFPIDSHEDLAQMIEFFDWQERQAKFIVQFVSVYKLYGFSFDLPLWANELIDFFLKVPLKYKLDKRLYKRYLKTYDPLGIYDDISFGQTPEQKNVVFKWSREFLKVAYRMIYLEWFYKQFVAYFKDDLKIYAPFSYTQIVSSFGLYRNPNRFYAQDYLDEVLGGKF